MPTWLYIYHAGRIGYSSHIGHPIEIPPGHSPVRVIMLPESYFHAGDTYQFVWYSSQSVFAREIAKSRVMEVSDQAHEIKRIQEQRAKEFLAHKEALDAQNAQTMRENQAAVLEQRRKFAASQHAAHLKMVREQAERAQQLLEEEEQRAEEARIAYEEGDFNSIFLIWLVLQ